jgi:hypothetical protein
MPSQELRGRGKPDLFGHRDPVHLSFCCSFLSFHQIVRDRRSGDYRQFHYLSPCAFADMQTPESQPIEELPMSLSYESADSDEYGRRSVLSDDFELTRRRSGSESVIW